MTVHLGLARRLDHSAVVHRDFLSACDACSASTFSIVGATAANAAVGQKRTTSIPTLAEERQPTSTIDQSIALLSRETILFVNGPLYGRAIKVTIEQAFALRSGSDEIPTE
jgi:hypothetical protein